MNIGSHGGSCGHSCCLRIQNLSVKIGNEQILENIDLHAHCGELIALIGPNGAGKSTLLKAILGQQEHNGIISFSVPGQRNRKPMIGYVPQSPNFNIGDPITVADLFACCMSKRPAFLGLSKAMQRHISNCLDRVHAEELMDKRVGALSGGELQRVLIALALEPLPNILILDEPLSGVDLEGMSSLMDMLDELRQTYDLSILMTTHDLDMLDTYADRVALIDKTILTIGTPSEVLNSDQFARVFHPGRRNAK
jgi:zinc transport system ATP-binding protein